MDSRISDLPSASPLDGSELLVVVQGGASKKVVADTLLKRDPVTLGVSCSDELTSIAAGNAKVTLRLPYAMTLTAVRASLNNAQSSGSILTVDVNKDGTSVLSTKLTIDNDEKTSTTAATPAVISTSALTDDCEISIDVDQAGIGAKGLKVWLIGYRA